MARSATAPSPAQPIQITRGDKTYNGSYTIVDKTITVAYLGRTRTTQIGGSATTPENLARTVLGEMVEAPKAKK